MAFKKGNKICIGRTPWNKGRKGRQKNHNTEGLSLGHQLGEKHLNYKGKTLTKYGYILIYQPNHPFCDNHNYVREHRLVAEKCLGKYLTKEEQIHHINGIKSDNRLENLYLFASNSKHRSYEGLKNKPKLISNIYNRP